MVGRPKCWLPMLPYTVLVVNGSSRKLRAGTVKWQWKKSNGRPGGITLTLTSMSSADDPSQMKPGDGMLFTSVQQVNQYLSLTPAHRKNPNGMVVAGDAGIGQAQPDLPAVIQKPLGLMDVTATFKPFSKV